MSLILYIGVSLGRHQFSSCIGERSGLCSLAYVFSHLLGRLGTHADAFSRYLHRLGLAFGK